MTPLRRYLLISAAFVLAALWGISSAFSYFAEQREAAARAGSDALAARELAQRIIAVRAVDQTATTEPSRETELVRRIAMAGASAQLPSHSLERIGAEAPRQTEGGKWIETPTPIVLRNVTLRQLITFLQALDRPAAGLRVSRLHLSALSDAADTRTWTAEAVLLSTVPAEPKSPAPAGSGS